MNKPLRSLTRKMPDVAMDTHLEPQGVLDWVGMNQVVMPMRISDGFGSQNVQATVQVYVDLADAHAKGIHMSRLYGSLGELASQDALTPLSLAQLLESLRRSHADTSHSAFVEFNFDLLLRRRSLVSDNSGWNRYPMSVRGTLSDNQTTVELFLTVYYSSTCPASAALARQAIQDQFRKSFGQDDVVDSMDVIQWLSTNQGIVATPHGQRSEARVRIKLGEETERFPVTELIDVVERELETPVQTAVKREDEQEFAIRNGQNPMFCEDAARKLKQCLESLENVDDYLIHVEHFESLHVHNAVSMVSKGVPNGYTAHP